MLPARIPNLLVNGCTASRSGMATNIPPHNLREVAAAIVHLVDNPDCTVDDLMRHIPGPDFPTGGFISGRGRHRGCVPHRPRPHRSCARGCREETKRAARSSSSSPSCPYGISKARVIEQIAELVRERKLDDIADLRDESDRDGMRIVIELKRGAQPHAGAQAPVQADAPAGDVRRDHARARRRRARAS